MFLTQPKTISMNISVIRKFTVLFVLSALLTTVISCSKEDEPSGTTGEIQGSWKITGLYTKSGDKEIDNFEDIKKAYPCFPDIVLKFNSNGLFSGTMAAACEILVNSIFGNINESKYEVKDGKLIITSGSSTPTILTVSFNGNQMFLVDSSSSYRIVLTKQ